MIIEDAEAKETVRHIVRKEGEEVKPTDLRCRALDEDGDRCTNQVTYDVDADTWVVFCVEHNKADAEAREAGEARVARFDRGIAAEDESGADDSELAVESQDESYLEEDVVEDIK